jgi:hypothetical protein
MVEAMGSGRTEPTSVVLRLPDGEHRAVLFVGQALRSVRYLGADHEYLAAQPRFARSVWSACATTPTCVETPQLTSDGCIRKRYWSNQNQIKAEAQRLGLTRTEEVLTQREPTPEAVRQRERRRPASTLCRSRRSRRTAREHGGASPYPEERPCVKPPVLREVSRFRVRLAVGSDCPDGCRFMGARRIARYGPRCRRTGGGSGRSMPHPGPVPEPAPPCPAKWCRCRTAAARTRSARPGRAGR